MRDLTQDIANLSPKKRALLEKMLMKRISSGDEKIPRRTEPGPCQLSFSQENLWLADHLHSHDFLYNISQALHINGNLDVEALQKTLDAIVTRHEALRTNFISIDGTLMQVVSESRTVDFPLADLSTLSEPEREAEIHHLTGEMNRSGFMSRQQGCQFFCRW